jgi:hypothetical protein
MAPIDDALKKFTVPVAFISGLFMEYMVFEFEKTLMILEVQAHHGFYIMFTLFILSPFLVTGGMIYYVKRDVAEALFASALVIPVYLLLAP